MTAPDSKLVCSHCGSVNRIPESRLGDGPICGKCNSALLPDHPIELTDDNFHKFLSRTTIPVIVDFWAPWCPPCRQMAPAFAAATPLLAPGRILAKLNTEDYPQAAAGFNITGIPCLIAFRDGNEVARQSGAMSTDQIRQWANSI